jgi:hypothetical protein
MDPFIVAMNGSMNIKYMNHVEFFLLGVFPASEFYVPTFRKTLSLASS